MFYEVRVLNKDGKVKKKISSQSLSDKHWKTFKEMEDGVGLLTTATKQVPSWVKRKLDLEFPVLHEQ